MKLFDALLDYILTGFVFVIICVYTGAEWFLEALFDVEDTDL